MVTVTEDFETGPLGALVDTAFVSLAFGRVVYDDTHVHGGSLAATGGVNGSVEGGRLHASPLSLPATGSVWAWLTIEPGTLGSKGYFNSESTRICEWRSNTDPLNIISWRWLKFGDDGPGLYDVQTEAQSLAVAAEEIAGQWIQFEATVTETAVVDRIIRNSGGTIIATSPDVAHDAPDPVWDLRNAVEDPTYSTTGSWIDDLTLVYDVEEPTDELIQVVRQYPRDDEHGFSGGRRIYPPPRLGRIVGRQS